MSSDANQLIIVQKKAQISQLSENTINQIVKEQQELDSGCNSESIRVYVFNIICDCEKELFTNSVLIKYYNSLQSFGASNNILSELDKIS